MTGRKQAQDALAQQAQGLADAELDAATGGGKRGGWIDISTMHQGVNRATGGVPVDGISAGGTDNAKTGGSDEISLNYAKFNWPE